MTTPFAVNEYHLGRTNAMANSSSRSSSHENISLATRALEVMTGSKRKAESDISPVDSKRQNIPGPPSTYSNESDEDVSEFELESEATASPIHRGKKRELGNDDAEADIGPITHSKRRKLDNGEDELQQSAVQAPIQEIPAGEIPITTDADGGVEFVNREDAAALVKEVLESQERAELREELEDEVRRELREELQDEVRDELREELEVEVRRDIFNTYSQKAEDMAQEEHDRLVDDYTRQAKEQAQEKLRKWRRKYKNLAKITAQEKLEQWAPMASAKAEEFDDKLDSMHEELETFREQEQAQNRILALTDVNIVLMEYIFNEESYDRMAAQRLAAFVSQSLERTEQHLNASNTAHEESCSDDDAFEEAREDPPSSDSAAKDTDREESASDDDASATGLWRRHRSSGASEDRAASGSRSQSGNRAREEEVETEGQEEVAQTTNRARVHDDAGLVEEPSDEEHDEEEPVLRFHKIGAFSVENGGSTQATLEMLAGLKRSGLTRVYVHGIQLDL